MLAITLAPTLLILAALGSPQATPAPAAAPTAASAAPAAPAAAPSPAAAPVGTPTPRDESLPASEAQAKGALERSPRHGELVDVLIAPGKSIRTWISYPERKDKAPVVLVIHEVFGLTDWIRAVADQLAKEGFLAVAPDLISGLGPGGGGTESAATRDDAVKLVRGLSPEETTQRLDVVLAYASKLPAASGKTGAVGFCWGGSTSFRYAASQPKLGAAVVYYGGSPDAAVLARVTAPVQGHYGGDDARVTLTVAPAEAEMKKLGKTYDAKTYEGAGHGFLRAQDGREGKNLAATREAWPKTLAFFREHLK